MWGWSWEKSLEEDLWSLHSKARWVDLDSGLEALNGLVNAFFFDLFFGWRVWLWVELKKGDSLNIFYILNLAGDEICFLLTRKRFIWSNKPIMSDLFCIQPPYSFYSGTQRRLCEVTSQAAGHNGLCVPWYTFWIYIKIHLDFKWIELQTFISKLYFE